ncbi:hypothetical protein PUN28_011112 [Cardiocondyla obscurior]|uniref:Secreted protein n=1 Tax=Cardiocondyla obscurior TaxID=286306 RepID=A0AAW2FLF4_9HYME
MRHVTCWELIALIRCNVATLAARLATTVGVSFTATTRVEIKSYKINITSFFRLQPIVLKIRRRMVTRVCFILYDNLKALFDASHVNPSLGRNGYGDITNVGASGGRPCLPLIYPELPAPP